MEKDIVEEISKELRWYERIIVKLHMKLVLKIYHTVRIDIVNKLI